MEPLQIQPVWSGVVTEEIIDQLSSEIEKTLRGKILYAVRLALSTSYSEDTIAPELEAPLLLRRVSVGRAVITNGLTYRFLLPCFTERIQSTSKWAIHVGGYVSLTTSGLWYERAQTGEHRNWLLLAKP